MRGLGEEDGGGVAFGERHGVVVVLEKHAENVGQRDDSFVVVHLHHFRMVYA